MRLLSAADHRRMPWKNGGGETIEIAVFPPEASLDDFVWRVSMARVEQSGPFSVFPGVDRTLAVLEGEMTLHRAGMADVTLSERSSPLTFAGDVPTQATVLRPVRDLNVMTRRGRCAATLTRHVAPARIDADRETLLIVNAAARLEDGTILQSGDALWLAAPETAAFAVPPADLWVIALSRPG